MDDRRFDSLVKSLASGASRRSVLKGLLGLGGVALGGAAVLSDSTEAARRPTTPTPTPTRCPGQQYVSGGQCICPGGKTKCGPDCCNTNIPAPDPAHSECCDNACCFGTCLPEEICCPTNNRPGNLPPTHQVCVGPNGQECCPASDRCCLLDGCCETVCYGGMVDADYCCSTEQFCPGGGESDDLCCTGGATCCGAGTDGNVCVDLSNGGCCEASECGPAEEGVCAWTCDDNTCIGVACTEGTICCQGACVSELEFSACPSDPEECCSSEDGYICCGQSGCCPGSQCNEVGGNCCATEDAVCDVEGGCCAASEACCGGDRCCEPGQCTFTGTCCSGNDRVCGAGCCPAEQCTVDQECCPPGMTACGIDCCDNATEVCNGQGVCVCADGLILCSGGCTAAQCCESDNALCAELGFDLECVTCTAGACDSSGLDYGFCDDYTGWCLDGVCNACFPLGQESRCTSNTQCCSNYCHPLYGYCDMD